MSNISSSRFLIVLWILVAAPFRSLAAGTGVAEYWLYISAASVGGTELYNATQGTSLSHTATGLPADGRNIYVRLWSKNASTGVWSYIDYTYR